jgi:hypothetical protein
MKTKSILLHFSFWSQNLFFCKRRFQSRGKKEKTPVMLFPGFGCTEKFGMKQCELSKITNVIFFTLLDLECPSIKLVGYHQDQVISM